MATILIVDDRYANRLALTALLDQGAHRLLEASNGAEALTLARAESPDLIITDMVMPEMNGYQFVKHLRGDPAGAATPVIFCSARYDDAETRALAHSCGAFSILPKPAEPEAVLEAVSRALAAGSPFGSHKNRAHRATSSKAEKLESPMDSFTSDLTEVFLEESAQLMTDIGTAIAARDAGLLRHAAHSLRGAAGVFNAARAVDLAMQLEKMGEANDLARAEETRALLETEFQTLRPKLESLAAIV
ncbi:MAG: response regulator [Chthoniobacterales bacterium]